MVLVVVTVFSRVVLVRTGAGSVGQVVRIGVAVLWLSFLVHRRLPFLLHCASIVLHMRRGRDGEAQQGSLRCRDEQPDARQPARHDRTGRQPDREPIRIRPDLPLIGPTSGGGA